MINNYFKLALRTIVKDKLHSFVNIIGLATGMAVAILIGLWMYDEFSFDKYYTNYHKIAQVMQNQTNNGEVQTMPNEPVPLGAELRKSFGGDFKCVVMATGINDHSLAFGQKVLTKRGAFFEPQGAELLGLKMIKGSRNGLGNPSSILLSESVALAYFDHDDPINKVLKLDGKVDVKVTGVYEDQPFNTTFADLTFIAPWDLFGDINAGFFGMIKDNWERNAFLTYVLLNDNLDIATVSKKIRDVKLNNASPDEVSHKPELFLHPMSRWFLYAEFTNGIAAGGRIQYIWLFGIIGSFVLFLACINFMNLSTARSEKRAKEVGIRKTIGSNRGRLIFQFYNESLLVSVIALLIAIIIVLVTLPFFNDITDKKMSMPWANPLFWLICICFAIFTGILAGSYPALYLSSFRPIQILKGTFRVSNFSVLSRKVLVVSQFTVSFILIIGTLIVYKQIQFAKSRPLGYTIDGLINLPMGQHSIHEQFGFLENELKASGAIVSIAEAGSPTTEVYTSAGGLQWKKKDPNLAVVFPNTDVSSEYGRTIGWQFKNGRDFSSEFLTDSRGFIINESAVKYMGFTDPIGEIITWNGEPYHVIGVIKDMIVESPYNPVQPSIFHLSSRPGNVALIKLNPAKSPSESIAKIEAIFKKYNPELPFDYHFVDEDYRRKFINEERVGKIASVFTCLAIFISCLGLFAMASFMAERRIKEISVRKVFGASLFSLWGLLSKDFMQLVGYSIIVGLPLSYLLMHSWLQQYQYRSVLPWWIFVIAGLVLMLISILTISYKCVTTAMANPCKNLKEN